MRATLVGRALVLGIRREDKNVWERRVPLTPSQVGQLLSTRAADRVLVQPATIRCFDDRAYEEAGAEVTEDLSPASTIVAVKEVPIEKLIPERTYMFFSHTIKAQPYNMPLLDEILRRKIRLFDYERIVNNAGRMVKFGPYAGYAGMIDSLHALGLALLMRGYATPFLHVSQSKEYPSLEAAQVRIREVGDVIRKRGIPSQIGPLTIAVTGSGSVSAAVQAILKLLPCKFVGVNDLPALHNGNFDNHAIYAVVVRAKDMVTPRDKSLTFSRSKYYADPHLFEPSYHVNIAPYVHVLINGMYWEPRFPRLLSTDQAGDLLAERRLPLLCLGDITCDPGGSVEFFVRSTTIQNPMYGYSVAARKTISLHDYDGDGVLILGVDHLPAEFPIESSTDFGACLRSLLPRVLASSINDALDKQAQDLGSSLFNAMVTHDGALTPNYGYIMDLRAKHEAVANSNKRAVVLGAGMVSAACVRGLQADGFTVAVVDTRMAALRSLQDACAVEVVNDTFDSEAVDRLISQAAVTISLLPPPMHADVAALTLKHNVPLVTTSYVSDRMAELRRRTGETLILNEVGLDPGIDIMTSADLLSRITGEGGQVESYVSLCGALPDPALRTQPMGYKFSWSPRGALVAATRPSTFYARNFHTIDGQHLYHYIQRLPRVGGVPEDLLWVPNGDIRQYVQRYGLSGTTLRSAVRGTIRYDGFAPVVMALAAMDLLNPSTPLKGTPATWGSFMEATLAKHGVTSTSPREGLATLLDKLLRSKHNTIVNSAPYEALRSIWESAGAPSIEENVAAAVSTFERLGLLGPSPITPTSSGTIFDALCAHLEATLAYGDGENDCVIMIHRVVARYPGGVRKEHTATLQLIGNDRCSATARTVGTPAAIAARLVRDRPAWRGLLHPEERRIYEYVLPALKERGIAMAEASTELPQSSL